MCFIFYFLFQDLQSILWVFQIILSAYIWILFWIQFFANVYSSIEVDVGVWHIVSLESLISCLG